MAIVENQPLIRKTIPVWDIGVRLFHWSLVTSVTLSYFVISPRDMHRFFGYAVVTLIAFRLIWGLIGPKHARFSNFIPGPRKLLGYLRDIARGVEDRYIGHNPAGAAMIVTLLLVLGAIGTTGYMMGMDAYFGEEWVEDLHKMLVNGLFALVAFHLAGVILASLRHRVNLIKAMLTGMKEVKSEVNIHNK
ncbi:cytochrome b/b6 domain-containing protein [Profundibacter sp.]|uniref:cytochrome b/b6 domain-containing protein n=1 Tax=Profundibacter sp. TaxID=3101071 RepID=UPI003D0BD838